jgi:hypothetical protein
MRAIDADALMETYADRMSVVADRYSPDSSECGILCGAMKLLSIQPTIEPDPDTVSRQAARDAVCEELDSIDHVPQWVFDRLTKKIENLPPSPTPSRPHGKWVFSPDDAEGTCTICQYKIYGRKYQGHYMIVPYNFCPNCGAEMKEDEG